MPTSGATSRDNIRNVVGHCRSESGTPDTGLPRGECGRHRDRGRGETSARWPAESNPQRRARHPANAITMPTNAMIGPRTDQVVVLLIGLPETAPNP